MVESSQKLSRRLSVIMAMVPGGRLLADVGTDHGYLPIALVEEGKYEAALAMDINDGPLCRARANIHSRRLENRIRTVQSDGLEAIAAKVPETMFPQLSSVAPDTIVIAGMGAALMERIVEKDRAVIEEAKNCLFSPHTDIPGFRQFLLSRGFSLMDEEMCEEDGQFYTFFLCRPPQKREREEKVSKEQIPLDPVEEAYGSILIRKKSGVLIRYLERDIQKRTALIERLRFLEPKSGRYSRQIRQHKDKIRLASEAIVRMRE